MPGRPGNRSRPPRAPSPFRSARHTLTGDASPRTAHRTRVEVRRPGRYVRDPGTPPTEIGPKPLVGTSHLFRASQCGATPLPTALLAGNIMNKLPASSLSLHGSYPTATDGRERYEHRPHPTQRRVSITMGHYKSN